MLSPVVLRLYNQPQVTVPSNQKTPQALRIGILGAADIAPSALIWPVGKRKDVVVVAVAARNMEKARTYAQKHGIPKVLASYEALISDPEIDAIYNPLPNGLHWKWTEQALKAGKHVLCEKPMASNAREAYAMQQTAMKAKRVLMEAFHYRFHPAANRLEQIVRSGELGKVKHIETRGELPWNFAPESDIRFNVGGSDSRLAGGALMDIGCYAVNCFRLLAGEEPTVVNATATETFPGVDGVFEAHLSLSGGGTGKITASMKKPLLVAEPPFVFRGLVIGEKATLFIENFIVPFIYHYIEIVPRNGSQKRIEKVYGTGATSYEYQLDAFVDVVRGLRDLHVAGTPEDAVKNMALIDQMYSAAGLQPREGYA